MGRWYARLAEAGLCFGPDFKSIATMSTDGGRTRPGHAAEVRRYLDRAVEAFPANLNDHASMAYIVAMADLASFKNPKMRLLELGGADGACHVKRWLKDLEADTTFPRCSSWVGGELDANDKLQAAATGSSCFDTVVVAGVSSPLSPSPPLVSYTDHRRVLS